MEHLHPDSAETQRLLGELGRGAMAAFGPLFDRQRELLRNQIAWRMEQAIAARVDASDIVQETQLEAYQRFPEYLANPAVPFRVWIRKLAWQRLQMTRRLHYESQSRDISREVALSEGSSIALASRLFSPSDNPADKAAANETAARIHDALSALPEADREVLLLRTFERLSYDQIAYTLELTPTACRKRYARALLKLKNVYLGTRQEPMRD